MPELKTQMPKLEATTILSLLDIWVQGSMEICLPHIN
jgi:hypothetical protein